MTILPMTNGGAAIENGTAVVRSGRIAKIGDVESSADGALDVALDLAKRAIGQQSRKAETSGEASP